MTQQAQIRFDCDRCHTYRVVPHQNSPMHARLPADWRSVWLADPSAANGTPLHLCPSCAKVFDLFLQEQTLQEKFDELTQLHEQAMVAIRRLKQQRDDAYASKNMPAPGRELPIVDRALSLAETAKVAAEDLPLEHGPKETA